MKIFLDKKVHAVLVLALTATVFSLGTPSIVSAQDKYIGEIFFHVFNYSPLHTMPCDGRILQIRDYQYLYGLIKNTYGGDGRETFALPDMRGRTIVVQGKNPTTDTNFPAATKGGTEFTAADHTSRVEPVQPSSTTAIEIQTTDPNGHLNMPPFMTVNCSIVVEGIYPPRP